jgi:hypothetical protein
MSLLGQTRKCPCLHGTSVVPSSADVARPPRQIRFVPIPEATDDTQLRAVRKLQLCGSARHSEPPPRRTLPMVAPLGSY